PPPRSPEERGAPPDGPRTVRPAYRAPVTARSRRDRGARLPAAASRSAPCRRARTRPPPPHAARRSAGGPGRRYRAGRARAPCGRASPARRGGSARTFASDGTAHPGAVRRPRAGAGEPDQLFRVGEPLRVRFEGLLLADARLGPLDLLDHVTQVVGLTLDLLAARLELRVTALELTQPLVRIPHRRTLHGRVAVGVE